MGFTPWLWEFPRFTQRLDRYTLRLCSSHTYNQDNANRVHYPPNHSSLPTMQLNVCYAHTAYYAGYYTADSH